jgi:hypothetical protein
MAGEDARVTSLSVNELGNEHAQIRFEPVLRDAGQNLLNAMTVLAARATL